MSPTQTDALIHGVLTFLATEVAIALTWFIGAATSHPLSIPWLLTQLPALLVALAVGALHLIQPDAATTGVTPPAPPVPVNPPPTIPPKG